MAGDWRERLGVIMDLMRDMSRHTEPESMVRDYAARVRELIPVDRRFSLSRRGLSRPRYRVTRSSTWSEPINPWKQKDRLPLFEGGLLAELIYSNEVRLINDLTVSADEPAAEYLEGHRSLLALPMFDQGEALNMVVLLMRERDAFRPDDVPDLVWTSNLFGRATHNLVLRDELNAAYQALDRELKAVGEIQRSLLPRSLPAIPTLDLAAHYQPARRAGGDYYDFFPLPDGQWGLFIGDVSGHGTPAAVLMAVTHCIAHTHPGPPTPPERVLEYLNRQLASLYAGFAGTFVTAFYGIYDPARLTLTFASAGHHPPRLKRCGDGSLKSLDGEGGLPLGIKPDARYTVERATLQRGDQIIFYTDGITEAQNPAGQPFGVARLDAVLEDCRFQADDLLRAVLEAVETFTENQPPDDDRTIVVARVV